MSLQIESFQTFKQVRLGSLNDLAGQQIDIATVNQVTQRITEAFANIHSQGIITLAADGMRVTQGKAVFDPLDKSRVNIKWTTSMYPGPRYPNGNIGNERVKAIALGYYNEYDLYVVFQGPIPPTIVARYGTDGPEYETFNPAMTKLLPEHPAHYHEAVERVKSINEIEVLRLWGYNS